MCRAGVLCGVPVSAGVCGSVLLEYTGRCWSPLETAGVDQNPLKSTGAWLEPGWSLAGALAGGLAGA